MKQRFISVLQLVLGLAILTAIYHRLNTSGQIGRLVEALQEASGNPGMLLAAVAAFGFCLFVCAFRWHLILIAQDLRLHFGRVLALVYVGQFFNAFVLGSTGGDVIKSYYVATETHHRRTEAVTTVFIDRVIGLVALLILVAILTVARLQYFLTYTETRIAMVFNIGVLVCLIGGLMLVFGHNLLDRWTLFRRLRENTAVGGILARVYDSFHLCLNHRALVLQTVLISTFNHICVVAAGYFIGRALGLPLDFLDYMTILPIVNLVSSIPITPAGIGTREAATMFLFSTMGVSEPDAVTLSLLIFASMFSWSVFGGLVYSGYVFSRGRAKIDEPEDPEDSP